MEEPYHKGRLYRNESKHFAMLVDHEDQDETQEHTFTSGQPLEIWLNGEWIPGRIEYGTYSKGMQGYYFISNKGGYCGLMEGMIVRYKQHTRK